jgi:hypothetical protein
VVLVVNLENGECYISNGELPCYKVIYQHINISQTFVITDWRNILQSAPSQIKTAFVIAFRGLNNYMTVKQVTKYCSDEPWGWYQPPSKL